MQTAMAVFAMNTTTILRGALLFSLCLAGYALPANDAGRPNGAPVTTVASWWRRTLMRPTWEDARTMALSPRAICALTRRHITLRKDSEERDIWSSAAQTWRSGQGDCEDFALLITTLCRHAGIPTRLYAYRPSDRWEAHLIVIGTMARGGFWAASNGEYGEFRSEAALRRWVARAMNWDPARVVGFDAAAAQSLGFAFPSLETDPDAETTVVADTMATLQASSAGKVASL